ncbi:MAG: cobalamin-dependent protein [Phycisphaeraceae bacterium]|nr:cobalamin-dependent protein [Phycisphaeraceae bacterium]
MVAEACIEGKPGVGGHAACLLLVPPLIKYAAGPLLGPAMLKGAAAAAGLHVRLIDMNIRYLRDRLTQSNVSDLVGDHDRDTAALRRIEEAWLAEARDWLPSAPQTERVRVDACSAAMYEFEEIEHAAQKLAASVHGSWMERLLSEHARPSCVGVSIMFSGQVIWALATAIVANRIWPSVPVLAGGAHITALKDEIAADSRYGRHFDRFVFGYAETTFVDAVRSYSRGVVLPEECVKAGERCVRIARSDGNVAPEFEGLDHYRRERTTLPAQFSRGCAYGKCRFCTYPAVEGAYHTLEESPVNAVIDLAAEIGGAVSFKDSLIVGKRLESLSRLIAGRVQWSACTKLHPWLNAENLAAIRQNGCRTLELGVETFVGASQRFIGKVQTRELFESVLTDASQAGVGLVVNTITGFPFEAPDEAEREYEAIRSLVDRVGGGRCKVEHNRFELERRAPLATDRGIRVTRSWPWSSLLDWEEAERPIGRGVSLPILG